MRRSFALLVLGIVLVLASSVPVSAGIEPAPFYTLRPDLPTLRARLVLVHVTYQNDQYLASLALGVAAKVELLDHGTLSPWVTETLRVQGLGVIDHVIAVLGATQPPTPATAERLLKIADRLGQTLTAPDLTPSEFTPQMVRALGHMSQGLGWDEDVIHPTLVNATAFDLLARITAVLFAPQPEPPKVAIDGIDALDRISAVLFAPQPEPPKAMSQALDVMDRVTSVLGAPQVGPPDVAERSLEMMERIAAVLFAPQPEPPKVQSTFDVMERVSAVLFAPQPEPPKVGQALNIMERISAVLFAPQPEPPKQPYMDLNEFGIQALSVVYQVSSAATWAEMNGFSGDNVPGMTGLTQLSKHLVSAVTLGNGARANAQLGAMADVSRQYAY
jgi:hypothetical protein